MWIPRPPAIEETGDRVEWLSWLSSLMRADAMVRIGTRLGLDPPAELGPVPKLMRIGLITEWPEAALYIGRGNLKHRQAAGAWSS
eukprot:14715083-Heterocapsa_arctica.AAC.1